MQTRGRRICLPAHHTCTRVAHLPSWRPSAHSSPATNFFHAFLNKALTIKKKPFANLLMKNGILCSFNFHLVMERRHVNYPQIVGGHGQLNVINSQWNFSEVTRDSLFPSPVEGSAVLPNYQFQTNISPNTRFFDFWKGLANSHFPIPVNFMDLIFCILQRNAVKHPPSGCDSLCLGYNGLTMKTSLCLACLSY